MAQLNQRKPVAYIELVYDLIFVYLVGCSNDLLLENAETGFFTSDTFNVYIMSTLVILQVWSYSTLFINRYGNDRLVDHICLFVNMYLLYFIGSDTHINWEETYVQYCVAWGLIYVNLALHYIVRMATSKGRSADETRFLRARIMLHLVQASLIFIGLPLASAQARIYLWIPVGIGFIWPIFARNITRRVPVNSGHLAERVMLYIVFTFGEMIIGVASYFGGPADFRMLYFSICAFLIVIGLFMSYGFVYSHELEHRPPGRFMMALHMFLIIALNNITVGIEFMHERTINSLDNHFFVVVSFFMYYVFLFIIARRGLGNGAQIKRFILTSFAISVVFGFFIVLSYHNGWSSVALSAGYVFSMYALMRTTWRRQHHLNPLEIDLTETGLEEGIGELDGEDEFAE